MIAWLTSYIVAAVFTVAGVTDLRKRRTKQGVAFLVTALAFFILASLVRAGVI